MSKKLAEKYDDALRNLPPSGGGGCHAAILGVANIGRIAGLSRERIASDLAAHVHGQRKVTRKEIEEAIDKAFNSPGTTMRTTTPGIFVDGEKLLAAILERGGGFTEERLRAASPVAIDWEPKQDAVEILRRLYHPEDRLFIGEKFDAKPEHIRPVTEWVERFQRGAAIPPHIIPNVLTGQQGFTKDGKPSFRADMCVARFAFATIEFDDIPRQQQVSFWAGVPLPVAALIDSGGKSIHGWVRIDAASAEEWTQRVEDDLFTYLRAVGVDGTSKNEARLSRLPGHFRVEKRRFQRLLYLNPEGAPVQ